MDIPNPDSLIDRRISLRDALLQNKDGTRKTGLGVWTDYYKDQSLIKKFISETLSLTNTLMSQRELKSQLLRDSYTGTIRPILQMMFDAIPDIKKSHTKPDSMYSTLFQIWLYDPRMGEKSALDTGGLISPFLDMLDIMVNIIKDVKFKDFMTSTLKKNVCPACTPEHDPEHDGLDAYDDFTLLELYLKIKLDKLPVDCLTMWLRYNQNSSDTVVPPYCPKPQGNLYRFNWKEFKASADRVLLSDVNYSSLHSSLLSNEDAGRGGGIKPKTRKRNHKKVYTGTRGGRYILRGDRKVYL